MKVLKFGGSSVGTAASMQCVRQIVANAGEPLVVVVSALGGVTDQLLRMSRMASEGDFTCQTELESLKKRHYEMVEAVVPQARKVELMPQIDGLLAELDSILHGVCLIQDLTPKTSDAIVAYGERLSSLIVSAMVEGAVHRDSRTFIATRKQGLHHVVDFEATNSRVREAFACEQRLVVVGGFIASDSESGVTTNLGRGGSDYTAAILAAALDADALEIWTDVNGFMTADPRIIPNACTIDQLSYAEAMELCNFGAKVVYPPTIYPVCQKNIPIYIKNTFCPEAKGSVIRRDASPSERPIRGISSVNETSMVTVSGLAMVGVIGVNRRIFTTLATGGISVFMVAQNASETSTSICMTPDDARVACRLLDEEFAQEIAGGAMNPASLAEGLASVAVVGERMRRLPGIAGKLFSVLGRNGISISAVAMGGQEMNLSFVVERTQLRKTLNVLHDSLFLSEHEDLNIFLCGTGTVGGSLIEQLAAQRDKLLKERGVKLNLVGLCGRNRAVFCREGINPATCREALEQGEEGGVERMMQAIESMNIFNSVFVDCTASTEVAACYERLLRHHVNIVAANKIAASSDYAHYRCLKELAREKGVKFLFETNVGAGLPVISTISDLRASGDHVLRIEAVLSGTLNYVFNTLSAKVSFSQAVRMAQTGGYSEPDPRIDLSGKDVVRKLIILARESGYQVESADVVCKPWLPASLFEGSVNDFWEALPGLDVHFEAERQRLLREHKRWRFVARWENGKGSVGLQEVPEGHPLYALEASNNQVLLTTERYHEYPMLIQGYGAGAEVTAAGVFADIMRIAGV